MDLLNTFHLKKRSIGALVSTIMTNKSNHSEDTNADFKYHRRETLYSYISPQVTVAAFGVTLELLLCIL